MTPTQKTKQEGIEELRELLGRKHNYKGVKINGIENWFSIYSNKLEQVVREEERGRIAEKIKRYSDSQEYETDVEYMTCEELIDKILQSLTPRHQP